MDGLFQNIRIGLTGLICGLSAITAPAVILLVMARKEIVQAFRNLFRKEG